MRPFSHEQGVIVIKVLVEKGYGKMQVNGSERERETLKKKKEYWKAEYQRKI